MQVAIEKKGGTEISFKVEIPRERVEKELSQAFRRLVKDAKVDGFRKGKVPRKIFERRFGKEIIEEEAIKKIYPEVYREILNEHKLIPIIEPIVEIIQFSPDKPLILKIELVNKPEVKLGKYKEIKVKEKKINVSANEIEMALKHFQQQYTRYVPLPEKGEVKKNDWVVLDYQVFHKGKLLPREAQKNFLFKIGSSQFPSSFSRDLIGLKPGEKKEVEVQLPSSHFRKDLAGEKLTFKVILKEIREEKIPSLDDEFAKNFQFDNLKTFKKYIQNELQKTKQIQEEKRIKKEIIDKVVNNSQIEIPLSLVERKVEEKIEQLKNRLEEQRTNLEDYLKKEKLSEEKLRADLSREIERGTATFFVLEAIAEREKIEVKKEEIDERLKKSANRDLKEQELNKIKNNLAQRGDLNILIARIREQKTIDFLYQKAKISK